MRNSREHPQTDEGDFGRCRVVIHGEYSEEEEKCSQGARNATKPTDDMNHGVAVA